MPIPLAAGTRRKVIGVLLALALVLAAAFVGAIGLVTIGNDRIVGQPAAILEDTVGPETGPACPLDNRYVDEQPEGLRPDVLEAWNRLRANAEEQGVRLCVQDGKRSVGQQQREFVEAVRRAGSPEVAGRYVLSPEESMHVQGIAVDVQPLASAGWVEHNGGVLGWCRHYQYEEWHFEYDPNYAVTGCPVLLPGADARPVAVLDEIPGPETGPACPLDNRYVDEPPEGLRLDVLEAWNRLQAKAEEQGVELCLHDGKRSLAQQQREFAETVQRFGSQRLARRYSLPPEKSMHVQGIAVDVQPLASAGWVEHNGGVLGWCRRYQNETWHFEYDPNYAVTGCPVLLPSADGT